MRYVLYFLAPNPCARAKCSHLCFLSQRNGHRCACADGVKLLDDGITCNINGEFHLFFTRKFGVFRGFSGFGCQIKFPKHSFFPPASRQIKFPPKFVASLPVFSMCMMHYREYSLSLIKGKNFQGPLLANALCNKIFSS